MKNRMNKLHPFIILLALLMTSAGCKKENLADIEQSLVGSWEIREMTGAGVFGVPLYYAAGNGTMFQFTEKNYAFIREKNIVSSGSYTVGVKGSERDRLYMINFDVSNTPRFFKIEDNKLTMYSGSEVPDETTTIYERVKDPILETR
ncbi:hypothetical protein GZH53_14775 [Flavihumibacter sp. R14]|nr:hypothetical protein [Flavihumibacter soli]